MPTDRIAGYPEQCQMSDNGSDRVRVTFPAYALDWYFYGLVAVDSSHYIYNTTRSEAQAITAKGGTEGGGYWFDTAEVYSTTNWVDNDLCTPQRQAAMAQYATPVAAWTASATLDSILLWDANTSGKRVHGAQLSSTATTVGVSLYGMRSNGQIGFLFPGSVNFYLLSGDLSGITSQIIWTNFFLGVYASGTANGLYFNDTSGTSTGVLVDRCEMWHFSQGISILGSSGANCQVQNCLAFGCYIGIYLAAASSKAYYSTSIRCNYGFSGGSVASVFKNCVAVWSRTSDFGYIASSTVTYCASSDATADDAGGAGNIISQTAAQLDFVYDESSGRYPMDFRIKSTSTLYHTGDPIVGITTDKDGSARDGTTPSIGMNEMEPTGTAPGACTGAAAAAVAQGCIEVSGTTGAAGTGTPAGLLVHCKPGATTVSDAEVTAETYLWGMVDWPGASTAYAFKFAADKDGNLFSNQNYAFRLQPVTTLWTKGTAHAAVYAMSSGYNGNVTNVYINDVENIFGQNTHKNITIADILSAAAAFWSNQSTARSISGTPTVNLSTALGKKALPVKIVETVVPDDPLKVNVTNPPRK